MNARPGPHRLLWVLGILILVGMAVGARFVLNGNENANDSSEVDAQAPGVMAPGYIQPEKGTTNLSPGQPGRVTWVIEEAAKVTKGDVLLRLDNRQAKFQLTGAEADLKNAEIQLEEAKIKAKNHPNSVQQQTLAVEIAKTKAQIAETDHEQAKKNLGVVTTDLDVKKAKESWEAAKLSAKVQEEKLKMLNESKPELEVQRAEAQVKGKQAQFESAKHAVDETELKAPSDGEVLRVDTSVGETFPNPRGAAIEFAPKGPRVVKAEVLQESADRVFIGQEVRIESDPRTSQQWTGKVTKLSDWIKPKRHVTLEPLVFNDVRTLDCTIEITSDTKGLRIGQRVRVTFLPDKK